MYGMAAMEAMEAVSNQWEQCMDSIKVHPLMAMHMFYSMSISRNINKCIRRLFFADSANKADVHK